MGRYGAEITHPPERQVAAHILASGCGLKQATFLPQVRYHSIPWLACVASQLYHSQEEAVLSAVDAAIEALRLAIDRADPVEVSSRRANSSTQSGRKSDGRALDLPIVFPGGGEVDAW